MYLPLCTVADTPFHIQGDEMVMGEECYNWSKITTRKFLYFTVGQRHRVNKLGENNGEIIRI